MSVGTGTALVGGVVGLALAGFGVKVLVTGRAPGPTTRSFRNVREAGLYHLLFGVALTVLVVGARIRGITAAITAGIAIVLVGVAVIRFRPRGGGDSAEQD